MQALARLIDDWTRSHAGETAWFTEIEDLILLRADHKKPPNHILARPAICVVAQGGKWTSFGAERHHYRVGQALIVAVDMPSIGRVVEASPDLPFLGAVVQLDRAVLREVLAQMKREPAPDDHRHASAARVIAMSKALTDCVTRLVELLHKPEAAPVLAPLVLRELCYWLLVSPAAGTLIDMTLGYERADHILRSIGMLREQYARPLRIAELAAEARLSESAFHRQFKAVTAMTPLQYQKQLRLLEARRLIRAERSKVEAAAYATGYESASQFSREYSRLFGVAPRQDAAQSRELEPWA